MIYASIIVHSNRKRRIIERLKGPLLESTETQCSRSSNTLVSNRLSKTKITIVVTKGRKGENRGENRNSKAWSSSGPRKKKCPKFVATTRAILIVQKRALSIRIDRATNRFTLDVLENASAIGTLERGNLIIQAERTNEKNEGTVSWERMVLVCARKKREVCRWIFEKLRKIVKNHLNRYLMINEK